MRANQDVLLTATCKRAIYPAVHGPLESSLALRLIDGTLGEPNSRARHLVRHSVLFRRSIGGSAAQGKNETMAQRMNKQGFPRFLKRKGWFYGAIALKMLKLC
jgi:hypothetical protein